jgi:5'-nucleotidase / UDP-sugar diphosphatase
MSTSSPMRRCTRLLAIGLVLAAGVLFSGCGKDTHGGKPAKVAGRPLTVVYTCDTQGYIFPCDCEGGSEGGIARRARFLGTLSATNRILVDAGDFAAGGRDWEVLQARHLLRGYSLMRYDAVNLGHREAGLGIETLTKLRAVCRCLVSANLVDRAGKPIVDPFVVVRLRDGTRVGIIGVMDDRLPVRELGKGLTILPPDSALGRYLPELRKQSDVVVLLAFADEETMLNLANLFYEISVIVGGKVPQPTVTPLHMNQATVVALTDKGKKIGRLDLVTSGATVWARTNTLTALTQAVPDDPAAARIQQEYQTELRAQDITPRRSFVDDAEGLTVIDARKPPEAKR